MSTAQGEQQYRGRSSSEKVNEALWGDPTEKKKFIPLLPTKITGALTKEQMSIYQVMFRIQEITLKLRSGAALEPPKRKNRSPSPPPSYDAQGKRINTSEQRYRRKLEEERHRLVEIANRTIPFFVPPSDYVKITRFQDKYYIPVEQYPNVNFVGLLLGPRGNTLKKLQEDSGCKISIRGRGSVKEGKSSTDLPKGANDMSDPLHCVIIADTEEKIQKGIKCCQNVVIKAVTSPEGQNDLKRGQLRELAELNGTLREDNRPCPICGLQGHKRYDCPNKETFAQMVTCRRCGQTGHTTRDCKISLPPRPSPSQTELSYASNTTGRFRTSNEGRNDGRNDFEPFKRRHIESRYQAGATTTGQPRSRYSGDNNNNQEDNFQRGPGSYQQRPMSQSRYHNNNNPTQNIGRFSTPSQQYAPQRTPEPALPPGIDYSNNGSNSLPIKNFPSETPSIPLPSNSLIASNILPPGVHTAGPLPSQPPPSGLPSVPGLSPGLYGPPPGLPDYSQSNSDSPFPSEAPPGIGGPPGL
ncbi:mRNA splicing protein MSL5 NDAI_0G02670 [Naumovozyma dairenensis CBS 421]|uniref:Branchpoint-bridging protein n=1 Tax=Naumovozyma dairenensis (strain ATCC 10597 / BCRC 20456 / CBS 421 / NBRC 0211 / NRRL Y-12639) TaxID=1071378 RepID=G0WE33_NAUDC|nr:hypothetical protein NDAI_0G02670 [Naumovozyma dairenensis CBS 421]CCD26044.2 hypothetical protein NDAI_0G02670 [Naumovozyma dairenensis CBS 421]